MSGTPLAQIRIGTSAFTASLLAHEGRHIEQLFTSGPAFVQETYNRYQREALKFQLQVGQKLGLAKHELRYIRYLIEQY